jgi:small subunit ribosomal protein S4e
VKKDEYKTGDVLKISFKDRKINEVYPFSKGNVSMIIGGSHIGEIANILDVEVITSSKPNLAKMKAAKEFTTLKNYVFPIGKEKPAIALPEVKMQ